ncbi:DUF4145 domain-containing protein [Rhodopseudomonas sp. P2A-2r]|uniref:DUF4145 domain-containing protein n=1 Tax=Rhodopseudomonas sp. P2A-2r TaxID=2991972 RepID=UPI0022341C50|nr:DUF4145 domain-containing protein [Rhodopseudomonas sp. P2A-2r]UZE46993.1 DUF4145 domain-containing protein [Rhodopseudomonas sp. P2A-2r]
MKNQTLNRRFAELSDQFVAVEASKKPFNNGFRPGGYSIEVDVFLNWTVKARNLLVTACGEKSEHYKQFIKTEEPSAYRTNHEALQQLGAIFNAAKEDFKGGYLSSLKSLVQAEVFDNELDQARELLSSGYKVAAAVIAGVVLETTLRQLCNDQGLSIGKLDRMNADLTKSGYYNSLVQKRITALADLRNKAAHGHADQFTETDVSEMISYVEGFVADRL